MIKKSYLIFGTLFLFACGVGTASAATFDASGTTTTLGHDPSVLTGFKASKQIEVAVNASAQSYAAASDHLSGTRIFGTASGDPLIYYMEKTPSDANQAADELGTTSDSSAFVDVAGWSSL
ncbi:MAG: hypothetical protein AB1461_05325 [Thermodesulfobacteriota bacterium]